MTRIEKTAPAAARSKGTAPGRAAVQTASAVIVAASLVTLFPGPALAEPSAPPAIVAAHTEIGEAPSNVDYSKQEEWQQVFPDGTFIVEHSEYTVREGGDDPDRPQDVYLGINIARMGGRDSLSKVTFAVDALTGDDADFAVEEDTVTFQPGEEEQTAYVKILDDDRAENDRFLAFTLIDAGNGHLGHLTTATIRILDNEEYIETVFTATPPGVTDKSLSSAVVTLARDESSAPYYATVAVKTADGTAKAGTDYEAVRQTVVFEEGQTAKEVVIPLLQTGGAQQGTVALALELSDPKGGAIAEGSESVEVRLTDRNPDVKNPIHNSESLSEALGESDQTGEIEVDQQDATENDATVAVNQNDQAVARPQLLANALGAARGLAAVQPFAASYWSNVVEVFNRELGHPLLDKFDFRYPRSEINYRNDVMVMDEGKNFDNADQDLLLVSRNPYNLNQFKRVTFWWENDPGRSRFEPSTHFGYLAGGTPHADEVKKRGDTPLGLIWRGEGYVNYGTGRANLVAQQKSRHAYGRSDSRELRQESGGLHPTQVRAAYFYGGVFDHSIGNQPVTVDTEWNQFNMHRVMLERSFIPDWCFVNGLKDANGVWATDLDFASDSGFSFTKDGFRFTIAAIPGEGGRWYENDPDTRRSGIYIGSRVEVTASPLGNRQLVKLELTDIHGKPHSTIDNFTLTSEGAYVGQMTWGTANTWVEGIIDIGSDYEYKSDSLPLNFQVTAREFAAIELDTTNVKHLDGYQEATTRQADDQFSAVAFWNHEHYTGIEDASWNSDENPTVYRFGARQFSQAKLNPQAYGENVKLLTNIPTYETIEEPTFIDFGVFQQVRGRVKIWAVDYNLDVFEPTFSVVHRTVERKVDGAWQQRFYIPVTATALLYERLHEKKDQPPTANALTLHLAIGNTKPNPVAPISEQFLIDAYRVDSEGGNDVLLFSFVHDTANEQKPAAEGTAMALRNVNPRFYRSEAGYAGSRPEVLLSEAGAAGITYQVYAPSYHDYLDEQDLVPTTFQGEQRIELRAHEKDSPANIDAAVDSAVRHLLSDITVRRPIPDDRFTRGAESFQTQRYDGQEKMYIYADNNASVDLPGLDFDLTTLTETLDLKVNGGPGISLDGDQITVAVSLSGTPLEHQSGPNKDKSPIDQLKSLGKQPDASGSGFNPANSKKSAKKAGGSIGGGIAVTIVYDEYKGRFEFHEFLFVLSGELSYTQQWPLIPTIPVGYASLGASGGLEIETGFRQVPVGMVNGRVERRILFNGFTITPSAYFSAGVGIGVADVASIGLSAFIRGQFSATLARTELTKGSDILDLDREESQVEASGAHQYLPGQTGAHKGTLLALGAPDGSATVTLEAKSFALRGAMHPDGARLLVEVYNAETGQLLDQRSVETYYPTRELGCSLYSYSGGALTPLRVEVSLDPAAGDQTGKVVQLDEISFKTMDELYTTRTVPGRFGDWNVDIGLQLNIRALIFSFDLDLIYFYLNQDGYGYGYPGGQTDLGTWRTRAMALDPHAGISKIDRQPQDAAGAETPAARGFNTGLFAAPLSSTDYFDLGDYAQNKTLTQLDASVFATARSQVVQAGDETYYFWIDDPGEQLRPDPDQRLILQYRTKSDPTARYVDDDGTSDFDFAVEADQAGRLRVAWTSFKQGASVPAGLSGADEFAFFLRQIEVKTAVLGDDGEFGPAAVVGGAGDERGDSMPALASNGGVSLLAFVKDEAGRYDADVKAAGESVDPEAQAALEDWNNALNQGIPRPYVALDQGDGFGDASAVGLGLDESFWKVGTRITSLSAGFVDASHVAIAFTAEIPNAQKGAYRGVDKLLFVQYGEIDGGQAVFGDAQLVQSTFDYDAALADVFEEAAVPEEYQGPTGLYEQPILTQAKFKRVAVPEGSGGTASDTELTLFYKLNEQLLFIPEASLKAIGGLAHGAKEVKTIDVAAVEYEVGVTKDGRLYLVYSEAAASGYDAQLVFKLFNEGVWSQPIQLTRSRAFDQAAYDSQQPTGAASFTRFTSAVDADDNLDLLVQTAYTPFDFTQSIEGVDGQTVNLPYLDEASPDATRELVSISFGQPVQALTGSAIKVSSDIFSAGDEVEVSFTIANAGDAIVDDLMVEFYAGEELVQTLQYLGSFAPGASHDLVLLYTAPQTVAHGTELRYRLLSGAAELYASTREQNYAIQADKAELVFDQYEVEVNEANEVVYTANVANIGHRSPTKVIKLVFEAMAFDENDLMAVDASVGENGVIHTSAAIILGSVTGYNANGKFAIPAALTHGKFYVRARIVTMEPLPVDPSGPAEPPSAPPVTDAEPEYSTANNVTVNFALYPAVVITTGFEHQDNILDVKVGQEIVLDGLAVASSMDDVTLDSLNLHEVLEGRDQACLNFDTVGGHRVIRVMRAPEDRGVTPVKVLFNVDGSTVSQALVLNVSRTDAVNLTGDAVADEVEYATSGWTRVTEPPPSPYLGDDAVESDGAGPQVIRFAFEGTGFTLYGDKGPLSGSVTVEVFADDTWDPNSARILDRSLALEQTLVERGVSLAAFELPARQTYHVQITAASGAKVVLDYLHLEGVHQDLPPAEGANPVAGSAADLDYPLVDGRNRMGTVSLTFTEPVAEAPGQDMGAFTLPFRIEGAGGEALGTA
ncbi:MAG: hypothetical protein LBH76_05060, partial [Propionibacteriaceae bacterium]|nr:hypothetical protein [Propionibacteriaceae bacterium]